MKIIESAVRWRHGTFVLFCLLAVFGILSLLNLPLELQPGGDRPEIVITTTYSGAGPTEVEDLITRPIEERMEEVLGVQEISSTSRSGRSTINLEFTWGSDVNQRLVDVLNRLQQVESLPEEAGESAVEVVSGTSSPMMWIPMAPKPGFKSDPNRNRDLAEEVIIPRLRRVEGTGQFLVVGGQEREVEVRVDPKALSDRNLMIGDVVRVLRENNRDIRGGPLTLGRREYRVRTVSRSQDLGQIAGFILRRDNSGTVYLRDVAQVEMGRKPQDSALMFNDNPIVVVENAFTHMQQGKNPMQAAIDGTKEVAGGLLGATLTNIAVFAPLVLVKGEIAQLFTDMAIAITAAALFSMLAAVTLVPMLSGLFLHQTEAMQVLDGGTYQGGNWFVRSVANTSAVFRSFQSKLESVLISTVGWSLGTGRLGRRLFILAIPIGLMVASIFLLPPADYLPEGNRNLVLWRAEPMPGTSIPEAIRQSEPVRKFLKQQPEVDRVMYVDRPGAIRGIAAILKPEFATSNGLGMMIERMRAVSNNFAGYRFMVPNRISIFRDPGKEFEVDIVGTDLNRLEELEKQIMGKIRALPGVRNARSNYVAGAGEIQVIPNRERLAEVGLSEAEVGSMVEAALGGRLASDYIEGKEELDVSVELQNTFVQTPEQLQQLPLYSDRGQVQLGDVAEIKETTGADGINHVDLERSITLTVSLAADAPLGSIVQRCDREILTPLRSNLPAGYRLELAGAADRLTETVSQLAVAFVLSIFIIYLLLVALYRSFLYPLVIMATVPMGMSGALLSLVIANSFPGMNVPLDMITALGFIILTGVVVNTSILIVERALQLEEEGLDYDKSVYQATKDRLRAIFMSAITSVLGMLPLAVVPGQGAELYQGLGIVLTGGLLFSTILTPTVVPALMGLMYDFSGKRKLKKVVKNPQLGVVN